MASSVDDGFVLESTELPSGRLVGKGLCGIVYETALNGKRRARKDLVGVPREVFREEALSLLRLSERHVNIVKTYGYTLDNRSCSLVLKYVDDDLLSFLQRKKARMRKLRRKCNLLKKASREITISDLPPCPPPLPLREAVRIMLQIATGMKHLHENRIAHGDLKPRNILLTEGEMKVKVADFGLVRSKNRSMSFVSRQARVLDMAQWKAPEYLTMCGLDKKLSESDLDEDEDMVTPSGSHDWLCRADVYSFGVTSFQILTGEIPFPGRKWKKIVDDKVRSAEKPKLRLVFQDSRLCSLLESCWGDSAERPDFATICEQLGEIEDSLKPKPIVLKRKQGEMNRVIQTPRCKQKKMKLAELMGENDGMKASSSIKPNKSLTSDSRTQDDIISEHTSSSSSESEGIFKMPRVPSAQRKLMKVTDSSSDEFIEYRPISPDSVLGEGFSIASYHERINNQVQKQRERDEAAPPESWAPPKFTYTSSSIKNKVSRALKCVTDSSNVPKRFHSRYVYHGSNEIPDYYFERQGPGIPVSRHYNYRHKRSDHKFSPETTTSENVWKKAFVRIPSKIQHWATNSVQFCKPNCKSEIEYYTYPGDETL